MALSNFSEILASLLMATSSEDVRLVLSAIGDSSAVELDQPFGPFGLSWHAFGNNPSNLSTIGLGTRAGRSLTERLTNSMDAVLEERASSTLPLPKSARAAAKQWFGRPVSGPDDGLYKWTFTDQNNDRRIHVVLLPSGVDLAPTIDVVDDGVGITPTQFPGTILSLQSGNKITKWYLIGAFGQGGAATLAFCEYALIVSRHRDNPRNVGFTLIRVLSLNETYKEDTYAYLSINDKDGNVRVLQCEEDGALSLYEAVGNLKLPLFAKGTLVRHFSYKLTNLAGSLAPSPGNLYHFLHLTMFDPIFPFRILDLRDSKRVRDELVTGSRNRLMKLLRKRTADSDEETGSEIRHYRPMEYVVPLGTEEPSIGIEYWVVLNYKKGEGSKKGELILRSQSNSLYVQTGHPILGTLNGQNQGELTGRILQESGLGMVARHIVIHIDTSQANSRVRRELFSTNREGFKEGPILSDLTRILRRMLEEDKELQTIERELTEKVANREVQTTSEEVRRQISRLLLEAGFQVSREGPAVVPGQGEIQKIHKPRPHPPFVPDPLPTLPFPDVTKFQIVAPRPKLEIHLNDVRVVLAETDADSEYDRRGSVAIRCEPGFLELAAKAPLRGGRIRWRFRAARDAKSGERGRIIATLTKSDGTQLADSIEFEVLPAVEEKAKTAKGQVPPFEIFPINPEDNPQEWAMAWPRLSEGACIEDQAAVAYRAIRTGSGIFVYYSTIFAPFKAQRERLTGESAVTSQMFTNNYEIWIGYHAILQEQSRIEGQPIPEDEILEQLQEDERTRVARMQIKQAKQTTDLMKAAIESQKAPGVGVLLDT